MSLAQAKCEKVQSDYSNEFIISADTLVVLGGEVYRKPESIEEAFSKALDFSNKYGWRCVQA